MSRKKKAFLTRMESFSAAHRLNSSKLSVEENQMLYGKCNNANGHGHNYKVEVRVSGEIDSITGMIMNISDLKMLMQEAIMDVLDHKHIDLDVAHFQASNIPSTAENIADYIFDQMDKNLPANITLESVKLHETDKNVVEIIRT